MTLVLLHLISCQCIQRTQESTLARQLTSWEQPLHPSSLMSNVSNTLRRQMFSCCFNNMQDMMLFNSYHTTWWHTWHHIPLRCNFVVDVVTTCTCTVGVLVLTCVWKCLVCMSAGLLAITTAFVVLN
jgi:hypothetical protein